MTIVEVETPKAVLLHNRISFLIHNSKKTKLNQSIAKELYFLFFSFYIIHFTMVKILINGKSKTFTSKIEAIEFIVSSGYEDLLNAKSINEFKDPKQHRVISLKEIKKILNV
jgi:hypothetical protein